MITKAKDQAFSASLINLENGTVMHAPGLSKREYFAIHILAGMQASTPGCVGESCAHFAVIEADKLIEILNAKI